MEYTEFTTEDQRNTLRGRIRAWEADHYGHTLNLAAMDAAGVPADDPERIRTNNALSTLEKSVVDSRKALSKFPVKGGPNA